MTMNKAKYESLPPDLKKVIDANTGLETSGWLGKVQQGNDARGRATVKDSDVLRFSQADYDQFKKVSSKVDESWVKEMDGKGFKGQQLLDGARALIQKHSK
jgi:TRAP-type C4-dicarboxylate transport system substrate-binding protein